MLGKRSRPTIGKLAGVLRSGIMDTITSPKSPLNCRVLRSSNKLKSYYCDQGGVGLGIIVSLNNTSTNNCNVVCGGEILAKYAICGQFSSRSLPIKVGKHNNCDKSTKEQNNYNMMEGFEEEFTYVTCHAPNKSSTTTTRVYYGGCEYENIAPKLISKKIGVFNISSPARFTDDHHQHGSDSDFLSSCYLCRKCLQGKDIYMYRGEKAFCSAECRQRQIGIDERKEQCRSEASRSSELSSSPYSYTTSRDHIFSTGILAI